MDVGGWGNFLVMILPLNIKLFIFHVNFSPKKFQEFDFSFPQIKFEPSLDTEVLEIKHQSVECRRALSGRIYP